MKLVDGLPRRQRIDLLEPVEHDLWAVTQRIEELGADTRLTNAVILLSEARNLVADYIEEKEQ